MLDLRIARPRFATQLMTAFAVVAYLLAAVGTYAVVSISVGRRMGEFGIRRALGAGRHDLLRGALSPWAKRLGLGLIVGISIATLGSNLARGALFGVGPLDALTYLLALLVLVGMAVLACAVPAWRALRSDPMELLRGH